MLKFMPEMLAKKQLTIAHVDVLQRKSLQRCIWVKPKAHGKIYSGQMRPK